MYGQTVALREREFVEASRAIGLGDGIILFRHVLPNGMALSWCAPRSAWGTRSSPPRR